RAGILELDAAAEGIGRAERDGADLAAAQMAGDLADQLDRLAVEAEVDFDCVVDVRELVLGELGVERGADDLGDFSDGWHKGTSSFSVSDPARICPRRAFARGWGRDCTLPS